VADLSVDFSKLPDMIWAIRHEMANFLRREADAEASPSVSERLRVLAAQFETGQTQ
jgi:hypothetical protein